MVNAEQWLTRRSIIVFIVLNVSQTVVHTARTFKRFGSHPIRIIFGNDSALDVITAYSLHFSSNNVAADIEGGAIGSSRCGRIAAIKKEKSIAKRKIPKDEFNLSEAFCTAVLHDKPQLFNLERLSESRTEKAKASQT